MKTRNQEFTKILFGTKHKIQINLDFIFKLFSCIIARGSM